MLNKEEIKEIIPQREPFLMIDEVESFEPGQSAVAYKNVNKEQVKMWHIFQIYLANAKT